jgi:hypothetical protein
MSHWETLDTVALLNRRTESTTTGNVGAYPVPLGTPLRPPSLGQSSTQRTRSSPDYMDLETYWRSKKPVL